MANRHDIPPTCRQYLLFWVSVCLLEPPIPHPPTSLSFLPTTSSTFASFPPSNSLQPEDLPQLRHRVLGPGDGVPHRPLVGEDLVVVTALERLVAEEVDGGVLDAAGPLGLVLEVLEAVGLVPARGEDVEGDLAADGEAGARAKSQ